MIGSILGGIPRTRYSVGIYSLFPFIALFTLQMKKMISTSRVSSFQKIFLATSTTFYISTFNKFDLNTFSLSATASFFLFSIKDQRLSFNSSNLLIRCLEASTSFTILVLSFRSLLQFYWKVNTFPCISIYLLLCRQVY